jgi:hypothetical protein
MPIIRSHHRRGFAGDGALVDRGHALDHLAVQRDHVVRLDQHHVAAAQLGRLQRQPLAAVMRLDHLLGPGVLAQAAQRGGLCLAAALGQGLGEVGEEHGEPQPDRDRQHEGGRRAGVGGEAQRMHPQQRREDAADVDDEHHRVAPLDARVQLGDSGPQGGAYQGGVEQAELLFLPGLGLGVGHSHDFGRGLGGLAQGNGGEILLHDLHGLRAHFQSIRCSTTGPSASAGT